MASTEESLEMVQIRVAVLGSQGVGKTSLIEKFISLKCDSEGEDSSNVSVLLEEEESQLMFFEKHCEKMVNILCFTNPDTRETIL